MMAKTDFRRLFVFLCLAALLLSFVTPASHGMSVAVLAVLWFFISITLSTVLAFVEEHSLSHQALSVPVFSPRPPPAK
jgi:hypothetical protein